MGNYMNPLDTTSLIISQFADDDDGDKVLREAADSLRDWVNATLNTKVLGLDQVVIDQVRRMIATAMVHQYDADHPAG